MSTKYFALLTQLGADKLANAAALGTKIEITHMAVGDGGGSLPTPDTKQTKLINEKRRAAINTLSIDPKNTNQIIAEQVIPENEGGWWIREIGLFDKDGILIAVGNCAETYKPQLQEGSGRTQTIRMILIVSSANAVTLKVDPAVILATREYVDDSIQKHANSRNHPDATLKEKGFVILSSAVDSNSETHAATPKAVKAAYDFANAANNNANGRVPAGRKVNGKALSADIALNSGDVGAYNKGETDTRVNEAKAQAKAANDNANGRVPAGRKVNGKALSADISLNSADVGAYNKAETDARVNEAKAQAKAANDNANGRVPLGRKVNGKALNADISLNAADVGAYNKDETNTKVNDIKSLANTANQNAVNANNNANTRLEKNKNGADIPNKNEFVKNLGLTETRNQAQNAVPSSRKVNGKALAEDVTLNAGDVQGEPRFNQTIDLTGLSSDRYYPVWWRFPSNDIGANPWLTIHRNYAEDRGDKNPFGKETHLAGLLLQIEGGDNPWGGDAHYLNIKRISQTYRNTVKNIRYKMMSIARPLDGKFPLLHNLKSGDITYCDVLSGCYLRGGLTYHVTSNFSGIYSSNKEGEVEISSWSNNQDKEIKWMVKSYAIGDLLLGKEYDDTVLPYAHDYAETINLAKNAYPITGGKLNGELAASNVVISQGDGRQHFALRDNDGKTRAYIYKDKGGDGIHVNNGYDGGGEWVFSKSGELICPGTINSYLAHTIRHTGYGRVNFVHQNTGDYIYLETTQDGKGIYFVQRNQGNQNQWVLNFPQKNGVVATTDDVANISNIPVGTPLPWTQANPPSGYLVCNGQSFNKSTYPKLGLAYPSGKLPDLRGEFIRGLDAGRNIDSGRNILSWQNQMVQKHRHVNGYGGRAHAFGWTDNAGKAGSYHSDSKQRLVFTNDGSDFDGFSNNGIVGNETRPRNIAFLYIVRAA